jgi:uncharacterized protein YciI
MAQYLYRIQPVRPAMLMETPTEEESRIVSEHFNYLETLMEKGIVILAGRTQTSDYSSFGIIIFNTDSDAAARQVVEDDPAVKNRVFRAEWFPYKIALMQAGDAQPETD